MQSKLLSNLEIQEILKSESRTKDLSTKYGVSTRTIRRVRDGEIDSGYDAPEGKDFSEYYGKLYRKQQRNADTLNQTRKQLRESARADNVIEEMMKELIEVFGEFELTKTLQTKSHPSTGSSVGIVHLSDLHIGERIHEVAGNAYDLGILAARLRKFAVAIKKYFGAFDVTDILIASTGDMMNSDRRLDEVTSNANNRSRIMFTAVEMLQQFIRDLNDEFNVTLASVIGNESRVNKDVGWTDFTASDSFDLMIHNMLGLVFKDTDVTILPMTNSLEQVVDVNGKNILLIHGHNGVAATNKAENQVAKLRSKYAAQNIRLDYVIFGHIHCSYISDYFARGASTAGGNGYSDNALSLVSKAAQNAYIVHADGGIDGIKVDLQSYNLKDAYSFDRDVEAYKPVTAASTVVIQKVLV